MSERNIAMRAGPASTRTMRARLRDASVVREKLLPYTVPTSASGALDAHGPPPTTTTLTAPSSSSAGSLSARLHLPRTSPPETHGVGRRALVGNCSHYQAPPSTSKKLTPAQPPGQGSRRPRRGHLQLHPQPSRPAGSMLVTAASVTDGDVPGARGTGRAMDGRTVSRGWGCDLVEEGLECVVVIDHRDIDLGMLLSASGPRRCHRSPHRARPRAGARSACHGSCSVPCRWEMTTVSLLLRPQRR